MMTLQFYFFYRKRTFRAAFRFGQFFLLFGEKGGAKYILKFYASKKRMKEALIKGFKTIKNCFNVSSKFCDSSNRVSQF